MIGRLGNPFWKAFVVDEGRENIVPWSTKRTLTVDTWHKQDAEAEQEEEAGNPDLYTQVCALLQEHERLEDVADELRKRRDSPAQEEMRRFFRFTIPLLDAFDRVIESADALSPSEETQNWLKSVAAIRSRMVNVLEKFGLRAMDPVTKPVDLDRHEVIEVLHTDSIPDETVVEVRQKGYTFDGKVLRDAQVVVAKNERG